MTPDSECVGPVLQASSTGDAIAQAIVSLNPDARIVDRGGYLRVLVPRSCRVTRVAIEAATGTPFRLQTDLESVMTSFSGCLRLTEDEAVWALR